MESPCDVGCDSICGGLKLGHSTALIKRDLKDIYMPKPLLKLVLLPLGLFIAGMLGCGSAGNSIAPAMEVPSPKTPNEISKQQDSAPALKELAQSPLGRKIELLKTRDGYLLVGIQYSLARDKFVSMNFSIRGDQLVGKKIGMIAPSFMAIMNRETQTVYGPWIDTGLGNSYITPGSTQAFSISVSGAAQVMDLVKSFRKAVIVIAIKSGPVPAPSIYLDLKELCEKNPEKFINIDSSRDGCP
jgi:hypothetical protein